MGNPSVSVSSNRGARAPSPPAPLPQAGERRLLQAPLVLAAVMLLLPLFGCGQSGPRLVPVTGVVTLDGTPVAGAGVMFKPAGTGNLPPASATTDADGKFSLATLNKPGAALGDYQVSVVKQETSGVGEFGAVAPGGPKVKWIVPQKYGMPEKSGLTATVSEKEHHFEFKLSSK
jgi:hypothetical protein